MKLIGIESYDRLNQYKSYKIDTKPSTHEYAFKIVSKLNKNIRILIVGSGTGALEARLYDGGFKNIYSLEYDANVVKFKKQKKIFVVDLNDSDFCKKINLIFDVVIGTDVIEHMYSPQLFLSNCYKLLKRGGFLLLSTPNVHSIISRLFFLLTGYPHKFHYKTIKKYEHFSPIQRRHFTFQAKELGFKKIKFTSFHNYLDYVIIRGVKSLFIWLLVLPALLIINLVNKRGLNVEWMIKLQK